ncbi:MAG: TRAM domain-containing protein [Chloroflexi bacterium]|nr:TRAM domain-containing protein [Chloroflexota bacterium]
MPSQIASRALGAIVFALVGWLLGGTLEAQGAFSATGPVSLGLAAAGALLGIFVAPFLTARPNQNGTVIAVILGLFIGLLAGSLAALPLSLLPGIYGRTIPLAVALLFSYLTISALTARGRDVLSGMGVAAASLGKGNVGRADTDSRFILDTSAIIDGRIADISQTGVIRGPLIIPKFVLQELQYIADSSDPQRRKRGRRGLDMLNKLQKESDVPIQISDADFADADGVDAKLVLLARQIHAAVITNDFNLNRVAELQGVKTLNINELALALKPVVLSGEEMDIRITQEGKEPGQGVGFLDDGTMVVVEGGRRYLNSQVTVTITRVLQTAIGRMIFAQLRNGH